MKKTIYTLIAMIGFANFTMAQVPSYVPTNGLVAWYPFSGNANDASGNGNNGSVTSATLSTNRKNNNNSAYSFNGNLNYISMPQGSISNLNLTSNLSLSAWYNCNINNVPLIAFMDNVTGTGGYGLSIGVKAPNKISFFTGNNTWYGTKSNNQIDGNWHNLTITLNSGSLIIYFDGVVDTSYNGVQPPISWNGLRTLGIGNSTNGLQLNGLYLNGKLDDIGIWNRALTQSEIMALYTAVDCSDSISKQPINQTVNINTNASFILATTDSLATYQWQSDLGMGFQNISSAGQFNGATNDTLIVSNTSMTNNNQNFRCIVSSGTCKDTSSIAKLTVNNNTGINSPSIVNAIKVYPNPASTILHIDLEKPGYYTAKLSSVAGQSIVSPTTGTVDISALANGVYILTIFDSNNKLISTNKVAIVK